MLVFREWEEDRIYVKEQKMPVMNFARSSLPSRDGWCVWRWWYRYSWLWFLKEIKAAAKGGRAGLLWTEI